MAIKTKNSSAAPSYIDFDPLCDLHTEEGLETLIINLPDFKKNQLKVQVNKDGVLRVSGERPTNADGTKRCRFIKDTKLLESCDVNGIRAKFTEGRLHVMIPKKVTPTIPKIIQEPHPTTSPTPPHQAEEPETRMTSDDQVKDDHHMFEHGSIMQRLHLQGRKVALGFGVAVVTMVAIGAFVAS
uniref:SHSP domain-containing protein n=1 Tax=Chenopodium quinoa TaxID=63459 RepID=A0A803NDG2_CHEQI